jgi:hypothetical protein
MFDVLILLAKIKKWFGQFGDLGGLFFWSGGLGGPSVFWVFLGFFLVVLFVFSKTRRSGAK